MSGVASPVVLVVRLEVQQQHLQAFIGEITSNAGNTRKEPGCIRFDVLQDQKSPCKFMLYEMYHDSAAITAHQQTPHFARWREVAVPMLLGDRTRDMYDCISNTDARL